MVQPATDCLPLLKALHSYRFVLDSCSSGEDVSSLGRRPLTVRLAEHDLHYLAGRLADVPVGVLVAGRGGERSDAGLVKMSAGDPQAWFWFVSCGL
ncbi:hypothetical protein ABT297_33810 [Dactylosporangium sp. NPDC000555]|uniref:hypothetical protein n=1 Tax=Dactylosporangium sp. NPDC000555 TaxID=3154260 RepID=UPI00331EFC96